MAVGIVLGGAAQFLMQLPGLRRRGFLFGWRFQPGHPGVKRIGILLVPSLLGMSVTQVNITVSTILASFFAGAPTYLFYGMRFIHFPLGIFGIAIATAVLPTMSAQAARRETEEFRETLSLGLRLVFFIMFFNAYQGVRHADPVLIESVRMLGASERQLVRHVLVPSALTWIFSSLQASLGFAMIGAVVGEYLGATRGLGYVISQAEGTFDTTGVFGLSRDANGELQSRGFPSWITLPSYRDLATGRRWHFFFAWLFVLNGNLSGGMPAGPGWLSARRLPYVVDGANPLPDSIALTGANPTHGTLGDDGFLYVVMSGSPGGGDGRLAVVDPVTRAEVAVLNGLGELPGPPVYHPSGRLLIASPTEGILEVSATTRAMVRGPGQGVRPGGDGITALALDTRGRVYAVADRGCSGPGALHVLSAPPAYRLIETIPLGVCPVAAVLVFDTSPRMEYRFHNQTRLEKAQEMARWLLSQFPLDSSVAVMESRPAPPFFSVRSTASRRGCRARPRSSRSSSCRRDSRVRPRRSGACDVSR